MATKASAAERPRIVARDRAGMLPAGADSFHRHAAYALGAAGAVFLTGTLIDLGILWVLQRQALPQWEFTAVASTAEALPRLTLALGLLAGALFVGRSTSLAAYRAVAAGMVAVALASAALCALMIMDYFALVRMINPEALGIFRSSAFKAVALSGLQLAVLLPLGLLGLRRPRE